jgi:hypothetical protein
VGLEVRAVDAGVELVLSLAEDEDLELALDLADLPRAELDDLERELRADVRIGIGLSRTLRNRRMRERGPLA